MDLTLPNGSHLDSGVRETDLTLDKKYVYYYVLNMQGELRVHRIQDEIHTVYLIHINSLHDEIRVYNHNTTKMRSTSCQIDGSQLVVFSQTPHTRALYIPPDMTNTYRQHRVASHIALDFFFHACFTHRHTRQFFAPIF